MTALARIHIAKKDLALDDDTYRAIMRRVTGKSSSRDLNPRETNMLLAEFQRLGWTGGTKTFRKSEKAYVRLVYALWAEASRCGAVSDTSKQALRAFIGRQLRASAGDDPAKVARLPDFLTPAEAGKVSEGLKAMIQRAGGRNAAD